MSIESVFSGTFKQYFELQCQLGDQEKKNLKRYFNLYLIFLNSQPQLVRH